MSSFAASDAREESTALPGCLLYRKGCARTVLLIFYLYYQVFILVSVGRCAGGAAAVRFRIVALSTIRWNGDKIVVGAVNAEKRSGGGSLQPWTRWERMALLFIYVRIY